ncbi:MAG: hypothetical protein ACLTDF_10820 [Coprococcus sp.]
MKNRSGIIKIVAAVTGAVSLLCMAVLLVNYLCNEHFISEYKKGQYVDSTVNAVLGFISPYNIIILVIYITVREITSAPSRSFVRHLKRSRVVSPTVRQGSTSRCP